VSEQYVLLIGIRLYGAVYRVGLWCHLTDTLVAAIGSHLSIEQGLIAWSGTLGELVVSLETIG